MLFDLELAEAVIDAALQRGLILLKAGVHGNCIRVLCPLTITDAELEEALAAGLPIVATNVGAQAFIVVNYGSGTPEEAAAWVRHANITNNLGYKYWEIGNENFGSWEASYRINKSANQDGQPDGTRPPEIHQRVHGRADGAAGVEHVVDQEDVTAFDPEGQMRGVTRHGHATAREVIAVQGRRDAAMRFGAAQVMAEAFSQPSTARPHAHQRRIGLRQAAHGGEQVGVKRFGVQVQGAHVGAFG